MSYNGAGTFLINSAGQPVVAGTTISETVFNALTADLATGLSTAITKNGQTTPTANIPMGGFKITGLGVSTTVTDAARVDQVQGGVGTFAAATFIGTGGAALISDNIDITRDTSNVPAIASQSVIRSNYGLANASTVFSIGHAFGAIGGAASGNVYGFNAVVGGYGGAGGYLVTGGEIDIQNYGAASATYGITTSVYGFVTVASGGAIVTCGYWCYGATAPAGQNYGIVVGGNTTTAAYYDYSSATAMFSGSGARVTGIDLSTVTSFSSSYAFIGPNASYLGFKDSGGTPTQAMGLNASNVLVIGASSMSRIVVNQTVQPAVNNTYQSGDAGAGWASVQSYAYVTLSDPVLKKNIKTLEDIDTGAVIDFVAPIRSQFIVGGYEETAVEEEGDFPVYETITENVGGVEDVDGVPTWVVRLVTRQEQIIDDVLLLDVDGNPAMETVPARQAIEKDGVFIRAYQAEYTTQRVHRQPRTERRIGLVKRMVPVEGRRTHFSLPADQLANVKTIIGCDYGGHILGADGIHARSISEEIPILWEEIRRLRKRLAAVEGGG